MGFDDQEQQFRTERRSQARVLSKGVENRGQRIRLWGVSSDVPRDDVS
ncbi:hypothetical protein [Micromonospora radicis]|nr:hypothetical protein [Micromonospora radicis]